MSLTLIRASFVSVALIFGAFLMDAPLQRLVAALTAGALAALAILAERRLADTPSRELLGGFLGLGGGLAVALVGGWASAPALLVVGLVPGQVAGVTVLVCAYLGLVLGSRVGKGWSLPAAESADKASPGRVKSGMASVKVVDTSVIIDGRIADVIESRFLEGTLVVPQFILRELQHVADSSDALKRARGRKGLDVLKGIRDSDCVEVEISSRDFPDIKDVDAKLLALAEELGGQIVTNDYNLNKVAQLKGVPVLNVNDLANAVKPVVLPGEMLNIQVIKEGKERNQGVGYLDDGTMVVVDAGRQLLGQRVEVLVTSVIQTNAGKMIFSTVDAEEEGEAQRPRVARRDSLGTPGQAASPRLDSSGGS